MLKCLIIALSVLLAEHREGYTCSLVEYEAGESRVPAYLLVPDGASADAPRPALVLLHDHGARFDIGKRPAFAKDRNVASAPAPEAYKGARYDRGHMCPAGDNKNTNKASRRTLCSCWVISRTSRTKNLRPCR